ncbi:DUF3168 domain-containing protein [Halobacillus karajensis]|uniref:DUF3168 domain-containing protein n=1 Tax=Halobacillus karajensis TaxID=195088 RepID=A0A059NXR0_9BACI|nr:DUF3168 domain-containing protein [Halobacillus karajensis]CDQ22571.1 hypothetical protein BN983_00784 [Halobacillus karajensis]CDQ26053.1 hypothetical protein BN981_00264 [Halobacillus karajensis]
MKTALFELQKAIYTSLSNHQPLTDKVKAILDDTEPDQAFPYVTIGEPSSVPAYTKTSTREEIAWTLHCWSKYQGRKESMEILNLMNEAFTQQPLSLGGGFSVSSFNAEQIQVITDIDGETRHGILRVRFVVHQ